MPPTAQHMDLAVELATRNVLTGAGGPFGAVVVKEGEVVAACANTVTAANDPTAHAEINAIRAACMALGSFQLDGCEVYTSCEPCPMCMAALYWARPHAVYYANTKLDAAKAGFDDSLIYTELALPTEERKLPTIHMPNAKAIESFQQWTKSQAKVEY